MVCQIRYIELDTNAEEGNYLIIKGYDVSKWLDQRIVWNTMTADGVAETFIRNMVDKSLSDTASERQIKNANGTKIFYLENPQGFTEALTEQVSYKNVGEKVRDYCRRFGWGYRVRIYETANIRVFLFGLYKGEDKSQTVIFSDDYENLAETKYVSDETNMGNVALVAGEGEGAARVRSACGNAESDDRFEIFAEAKDLSKTITWEELTDIYPLQSQGGHGYISGSSQIGYVYMMTSIDILILDSAQLASLKAQYPSGTEVTIDGNLYYRISSVPIANLPHSSMSDTDEVVLKDIIYSVYLLTRGYEDLAEYGAITSFEGTAEPNTTFIYKEDYFLGDIVTVQNSFGISVGARIVEVVEVNDDNGYRVEPKFEYIQED